jgi:hypothetical protein
MQHRSMKKAYSAVGEELAPPALNTQKTGSSTKSVESEMK